jgi:hypothetical protein
VPRDRLPNRRGLKLGKRHLRLSAVALVKLVPDRRPSEHPGQQANASTYRSPTTATRDGTETGAPSCATQTADQSSGKCFRTERLTGILRLLLG